MVPAKKKAAPVAKKKAAPAAKKAAPKKPAAPKKNESDEQEDIPAVPKASKVEKPQVQPQKEHVKVVPRIRIRLSAFDHTVLDEAAAKIIDTAERSGAVIHGPIPLPTKIRKFTVQRASFKFKDARDQFEMRTHRRLIDLTETTFKTVDALQNLSLPSGVDIEIRMG